MTNNIKNIVGAYLVPGLPHVLSPEKNPDYRKLHQAMKSVATAIEESGAKRILYYSTQWLSVLGLSFQAQRRITGKHVDENWHMLPDLEYDFNVDRSFAEKMSAAAGQLGYQTSLVDYDHFPIDTATIVANQLLNPNNLPVGMIASHVYSNYEKTVNLCAALRQVIAEGEVPTVVVGIGLLTTNFHNKMIDFSQDKIVDKKGDDFCKQILGHFEASGLSASRELIAAMVAGTRTDMALKSLAFIEGMTGGQKKAANVMAYGSLFGAGAAVVSF